MQLWEQKEPALGWLDVSSLQPCSDTLSPRATPGCDSSGSALLLLLPGRMCIPSSPVSTTLSDGQLAGTTEVQECHK